MNEEFSEEQKHDIDYWRLYDNEMQNQRKHIAEFIILFDVVFILQYKFAEIIWKCQITSQYYWIRERH